MSMLVVLGAVLVVLAWASWLLAVAIWEAEDPDPLGASLWFGVGLLFLFVAVPMIAVELGWGA